MIYNARKLFYNRYDDVNSIQRGMVVVVVLGTKKFWLRSKNMKETQQENQILKNTCYINIQIFSVNYKSNGSFWQRHFNGTDKIALTTSVKYQANQPNDSIESAALQDFRTVPCNISVNLGLQRNIAVKIPAHANALELSVKMTSVHDDLLQAKFDMLNASEFQSALQLAPPVIGQALVISSLVKKLLTNTDPQNQLEAEYAGIISMKPDPTPISNGKLTGGYLILIATDDGASFSDVDEAKFELCGDTLKYAGKTVDNTYIIFNITYEDVKGPDQDSHWFKRYSDALTNLDKLLSTTDQPEIFRIFQESKDIWREANALLETDATYLYSEKMSLKTTFFNELTKKYSLTAESPQLDPKLD